VPCPCATLIAAIPPDLLPELADVQGREDGFTHRILGVFPEPVFEGWSEDIISPQVEAEYEQLIRKLWCLNQKTVYFTIEGKEQWIEWNLKHHQEMNTLPEYLWGPWSKFEAYCARLALVIQTIRYATGETSEENVDEKSVASAITIIEYLKGHTRKIYRYLRSRPRTPGTPAASAILQWAQVKGKKQISARELYTWKVGGIQNTRDAEEMLKMLEEQGYGRLVRITNKRGRPQVVFVLKQ